MNVCVGDKHACNHHIVPTSTLILVLVRCTAVCVSKHFVRLHAPASVRFGAPHRGTETPATENSTMLAAEVLASAPC